MPEAQNNFWLKSTSTCGRNFKFSQDSKDSHWERKKWRWTHALRVGGAYSASGLTGGGFSSTTSTPDEFSSDLKASAAPSTARRDALNATRPARFLETTLVSESPRSMMRPVEKFSLLMKFSIISYNLVKKSRTTVTQVVRENKDDEKNFSPRLDHYYTCFEETLIFLALERTSFEFHSAFLLFPRANPPQSLPLNSNVKTKKYKQAHLFLAYHRCINQKSKNTRKRAKTRFEREREGKCNFKHSGIVCALIFCPPWIMYTHAGGGEKKLSRVEQFSSSLWKSGSISINTSKIAPPPGAVARDRRIARVLTRKFHRWVDYKFVKSCF